ncbi:MAG: hypothetical protein WAX85_00205 [Minisyncoccia bacterium]
MKTEEKEKKIHSKPTLRTTLLLAVVILFLFNFNFEVFTARAALSTIIGEGTPGYIAKWMGFVDSPTTPTITGPITGALNTPVGPYSFSSTDPNSNQIRYGIDWDMDSIVDEWLPSGSTYVISGTPQSTNHVWTSIGSKTFQAKTINTLGLESSLSSPYSVTIGIVPTVDITCGAAQTQSCAIVYNTSSSINWISTNSDTCTVTGVAGTTTSGTAPVGPLTLTTIYTATCTGPGGTVSDTVTITAGPSSYTVQINNNAKPEGGSVKSTSDTNINCSPTCASSYSVGSVVTLQAIPDSSYWQFDHWTGDCSGTSAITTITVDSAKNCVAIFVPRPFIYQEF